MRRNATKYFKIAISTYLLGALFICRGAKNSYFFCRAIDDCADGDVELDFFGYSDFVFMIERLREVINRDQKPKTALELLAFKSSCQNNGEIRMYLLKFLDAMIVERNRRINKELHTEKELTAIHQASFDPVLRIAFVSFGTNFSDYIIESLTAIQSKVYSVQDLEEDIGNGIYNLPSGVEPALPITFLELSKNPKFINWVNNELTTAQTLANELLEHKYPQKTQKVIDTLVLPILADIKDLLKE